MLYECTHNQLVLYLARSDLGFGYYRRNPQSATTGSSTMANTACSRSGHRGDRLPDRDIQRSEHWFPRKVQGVSRSLSLPYSSRRRIAHLLEI